MLRVRIIVALHGCLTSLMLAWLLHAVETAVPFVPTRPFMPKLLQPHGLGTVEKMNKFTPRSSG